MTHAVASSSTAVRALPALLEHKIARFAAILVLYFMQGVPLGLTLVALPGWLVEGGGYGLTYYAVAAITLLGLALCLSVRVGDDRDMPGATQ